MTKPTGRKKRSKLTAAILSPILLIVFIVGWALFLTGSRQPKVKQTQKPIKSTTAPQDNVELIVIPIEEIQIQEHK
jgi:flagellar basal body-associated protein FliL